ncbi:2-oxoacid:acceptor oxidoreductase family protein [Paratractidigestivibacter sp.]|uniref:2-oxoacid:acceptor oxidoreductase family protein n=1 Tax=Paratractidigestivibacter sp. TaxID=2847316 RepID=UPI002AC93D4A|nr:2-oxoacid:acceptor oxidoreductase family protein [Paratractidigestivibacter sp.]
MLNIMITGVGGQGTVLAAKLLAQAAEARNWRVRTAETIGMAQRGGSVVSHVRLGNDGEKRIDSPLIAHGEADLIIAFEPAEAVRVLPYLREGGCMVTATSAVQPVTAALSKEPYTAGPVLDYLAQAVPGTVLVDDRALIEKIGSPKALNVALLACALACANVGISVDELREAVVAAVRPQFHELNLRAVDAALASLGR